jgi:hypothetical protein
MSPDLNPASYSQRADNGPSGSNPFNEVTTKGDPFRPIVMNRPFRSVGEMAYAFRDQPFKTLDFSSPNTSDAALLDLFTVNDYSDPSSMRAGVVSLNTRQAPALATALSKTIVAEGIAGAVAPSPSPISNLAAANAAGSLALFTSATPAVNKGDLSKLIASETGLGASVPKTQRESIARALGEVSQTRAWNLMIDVIAQSGRYPQNAASGPNTTNPLANFLVDGEQHYWVHVAIDRFTGQVIDKQIEVVNE